MNALSRLLSRYRRDERGSIVLEAVLILPAMIWAYLALYTFWDAYRAMNISQRAAYTISDMISREQVPVNAAYIAGMKQVMDYMLVRDLATSVRVTSVVYEEDIPVGETAPVGEMLVEWSQSTAVASYPPHTDTTLDEIEDKIPAMSNGDTIILVETWVPYEPTIKMGVETEMLFTEFIVTRPRFAPRITFQ